MLLNVLPKSAQFKGHFTYRGYLSIAVIVASKYSLLKYSVFSYYTENKLYNTLLGHILLS